VVDAWIKAVRTGLQIGTFDSSGRSWSDIGDPSAYASAIVKKLRSDGEAVYIDRDTNACENIEIDGHIVIEKGCSLGKAASIKNCIVLPGTTIKAATQYENSIIGDTYAFTVDENAFGLTVEGKRTLIGIGGSDRKYFRINEQGRAMVLMECSQEDPDYVRHIEYTGFFRKYDIPVPGIFNADFQKRIACFEDLGDISLYSWLKCPRSDGAVEAAYKKVLEILSRLHCAVSDNISECPALASRVFDYDHLRWETSYFMERFVIGLRNIHAANPASLEEEFHSLANKTDAFRKRIIHRDFQSQNIMMTKGGVPRIIDYQGARLAPPAYDVASLLWDPYSPLKEHLRTRLLAFYMKLLSDGACPWFDAGEFAESLLYCRLQRHMQALGAYGYLYKIKGKPYFLKHVTEGIRLLREDAAPVQNEYPVLYDLISSL
jgi:aminoglycoside/choline kinase family phosphotransferase